MKRTPLHETVAITKALADRQRIRILMLLTGGVYPLLTTALGQWWFPRQANGSLIQDDHGVRGSALIGQNFTSEGYFQGRPSATAEMPYNPMASGGSNLAGSNPELDKAVAERVAETFIGMQTALHQCLDLALRRQYNCACSGSVAVRHVFDSEAGQVETGLGGNGLKLLSRGDQHRLNQPRCVRIQRAGQARCIARVHHSYSYRAHWRDVCK